VFIFIFVIAFKELEILEYFEYFEYFEGKLKKFVIVKYGFHSPKHTS